MGDTPPAPSPPPSPSKTPTFWALWSVSRMGGAGVKGEIAGAITPTSIPLPLALFSSGRTRGRGIKVGPTMFLHLDLPRPLPRPPSSAAGAPIAPVAPLRRRGGGGQVRGTNSHPTTHVILCNPRCSPHPHCLSVGIRGWGVGYNPSPPTSPTAGKDSVCNSMGADRDTLHSGGEGGVEGCLTLSAKPGSLVEPALAMQSPPQTHPPLLHHPAPDFWTSLPRDIQKSGEG